MSMQWAESQLRQTGDAKDAAYADMLAAIVAARGDIPFPEDALASNTSASQPTKAGRLAVPAALSLRTSSTDILTKNVADLTTEQVNLGNLLGAIKTVIDPYERLFKAEIPSAEQNPRTMFRKRVIRGEEELRWGYKEARDDMQVDYVTTLTYAKGEESNKIKAVKTTIKSQHDPVYHGVGPLPKPAPVAALQFRDGTAAFVTVSWNQPNPIALLKLTEGTTLGDMLRDSYVFTGINSGSNVWGDLVVNLDDPQEPKLKLEQYIPGAILDFSYGPKLKSTFVYHAGDNKFTRHIRNVQDHKELGLGNIAAMSPDEFVQLIADILRLIPTVEDSRLFS